MGQISRAIGTLLTIGVSAGAMVFAAGCGDAMPPAQSNANTIHSDVTNVRPIEPAAPAAYQPPVYENTGAIPTAPQAVTSEASATNVTPMMSTTPAFSSTTGEKSHTVRKGETLFSIAKATYGSGKDWKKIEAANPGVTPSKLKVGQVLAMP